MDIDTLVKNIKQFKTLPCWGNSKVPCTKHGLKEAKSGQNILDFINAGKNIGLCCADSGLIAIDYDIYKEKAAGGIATLLQEKEEELGKLPLTLTQETPRGGKHYIYSSEGIIQPRGKIGDYIDIRYNAYILFTPSSINGKYYTIIDGIDDEGNFIISKLPQNWIDYLNGNSGSLCNKTRSYHNTKQVVVDNINIQRIFDGCAFLRHCVENAASLSEPEWFSMISILSCIKDSDALIHRLSLPYPRYNFEETQKKIKNARKFGHPQTCEYISSCYPSVCITCSAGEILRGEYYDK